MPRKLEVALRKGDVSQVEGIIAEHAHATWKKLPEYTKSYMSFDDVMSAGINHTVTNIAKYFKSNHKSKLKGYVRVYKGEESTETTTYIYAALKNFYSSMLEEAYADKRVGVEGNRVKVLSADSTLVDHKGTPVLLFDAIRRNMRHSFEDAIILRIDAERAFLKVYSQASPHLRKHLINWCIQPSVTKYKLSGSKFVKAKREFRNNDFGKILTSEIVDNIQNDVICRSQIVVRILKDTRFRTIVKSRVLEKELLPAVHDPEQREYFDLSLLSI